MCVINCCKYLTKINTNLTEILINVCGLEILKDLYVMLKSVYAKDYHIL